MPATRRHVASPERHGAASGMLWKMKVGHPMTGNAKALEPHQLLEMYRQMVMIRRFDQRAVDEFHAGNIPGGVHTYIGQEAVAVGVCAALRRDDKIVGTHRGHGHTIAKGADIKRMMAELFGRSTGYCHGKGGSMHIADFSVGMLGANGIVGAGLPIATGAALAAKLEGSDGWRWPSSVMEPPMKGPFTAL